MFRDSVPRTYSWSGPVWQGDVDPFGELHTTTTLRFLQETAQRASTDAGYGPAYYQRADRLWLVRRTTAHFLAPIRAGDEMEGRTWVADFRRVRSQRDYEIRVDGHAVTRATTDWVFVDQSQGRPRRIPPEVEATFRPEGGHTSERASHASTPPPAAAWRFARRVESHELDNLNHVNNANYARYVEEGILDVLSALGWPLEQQLASGGRMRRIEHDFEYLTPAVYGDRLETVVWPHAVDAGALEFAVWITRPDARRPLLRARSRYAWTSTEAPPASATMPAALREAVSAACG